MTAPDMSVTTDSGRFYHKPGSQHLVPSITNVINKLAKPGIAYWGYKQCGLYVAEELDALMALKDRSAIVDLVKNAPRRSTDKSSNRGDTVHDWIDRRVRTGGKEPTDEQISAHEDASARNMWRHFLALEEAYKIEWVLSETTVWSDQYGGYAGTIDWMAKVLGFMTLGDTKTGNNIYPSVGMQLAAAFYADYAFDDNGNQFELPKAERFAALHLRPQGARLNPIENMEENFKSFVGLRAAFEWEENIADKVIKYSPKIQAKS